jgi:tetratricopeptide (TPR) repeat protein
VNREWPGAVPSSVNSVPGPPKTSSNELSGTLSGAAVQASRIHGNVNISLGPSSTFLTHVPAQLPLVTASFTDRAAELSLLDKVLAEHDPARRLSVAVLSGSGGAGKTSLGAYWLHRISARFPGGALYANLHGHEQDAAAWPADVLAGFLRALGLPPGQIPITLEELAAQFRTVTSGRRMLVFLDDAASAAQVRALLPGPGPSSAPDSQHPDEREDRPSMVLVTTRWRLPGLATEGARFIDVGPLDEASAATLFARMAGTDRVAAEPDAAKSVVRMCAGLPLAVCVAGARAASRAQRPLARLAADLGVQQRRLAVLSADDLSVSAAFDTTYDALPDEVARGYRLLSAIPGPDFGLPVAAACIGCDADLASDTLDALTGASLMQETRDQRFRYHDLVKLHALERGRAQPGAELEDAAARVITWYLERAIAADLVVIPGRWRLNPMYELARAKAPAFAGPAEALAWLESEQDCLCAAVAAAHDLGLLTLSWQLCEALWGLFANRNYFHPWIQTHRIGIAAAQSDGNRRAEARMRMQLGLAFRHLHQLAAAREQNTLALALDRDEGHRIGEATELEQLGLIDLATGGFDAAIRAFAQAESIFQEIGRPRGAAMMTCRIGEANRDAGRYPEAIRHLAEARRMFAALPDHYNEARATGELGRTYLLSGELGEAGRLLTAALDGMISMDSLYEQARIRVALADTAARIGDTDGSRRHLELALAVYDELGAPEAQQVSLALAGHEGTPGPAGDEALPDPGGSSPDAE